MDNIRIEKLNKTYGDLKLLNDFNCVFKKGSFNIIVGESGIGKTTLLKILMGIENFDTGSIINISDDISPVFQENRLLEKFTVYENIDYVLKDIDRKDIYLALEEIGLKDQANERVCNLSGGMKRRVAILRALLKKSELYIFDEPFKDMDDNTYMRVIAYVKAKLDGKTVIMTTHRLSELEYFNGNLIEL